MAKSNPGRCVHCLQQVDAITEDHLFPRSWYPATTPQNLAKWKFPACGPCNKEYGKMEEELRLLLAACVDPKSDAAAGIWARALDSIDPDKARDPVDALKRKSARRRFLARVREADPSLANSSLPEIYSDRPKGRLALVVPAKATHKFIEKLVRGTIYLTEQRYIEDNQEITVSLLKPEHGEPILRLVEEFGELHDRGPGIRIRKAVAQDATANALFVFDIWDQFRFHGAVMDRGLE
jgi:hypothetical protein